MMNVSCARVRRQNKACTSSAELYTDIAALSMFAKPPGAIIRRIANQSGETCGKPVAKGVAGFGKVVVAKAPMISDSQQPAKMPRPPARAHVLAFAFVGM